MVLLLLLTFLSVNCDSSRTHAPSLAGSTAASTSLPTPAPTLPEPPEPAAAAAGASEATTVPSKLTERAALRPFSLASSLHSSAYKWARGRGGVGWV